MIRSLLLFLVIASGMGRGLAQAVPDRLDPEAFQAAVKAGTAQLIDVRTPQEFAKGHLAGAENIDWINEDLLATVAGRDRTEPVLLYCAVGGRSEEALEAMRKAGFTHVQDLKGGINAWKANGLPITTK